MKMQRIILIGQRALVSCLAVLGFATAQANAAITFFTGNPSGNSVDWTSSVTAAGATINSNVDFDDLPVGSLPPNHYQASDGVTFSGAIPSISVNPINQGATPPVPNGEGVHPISPFLEAISQPVPGAPFTITFANPVLGAGFFTFDKFSSSSLTVTALDSANQIMGTQTLTGIDFQSNRLFFVGLQTNDATLIKSLSVNFTGEFDDRMGIDDVRFAVSAVPEPTSLAMLSVSGLGLAIGAVRRRRLKRTPAA